MGELLFQQLGPGRMNSKENEVHVDVEAAEAGQNVPLLNQRAVNQQNYMFYLQAVSIILPIIFFFIDSAKTSIIAMIISLCIYAIGSLSIKYGYSTEMNQATSAKMNQEEQATPDVDYGSMDESRNRD